MSHTVLVATLLAAALESAILLRILWGWVALPCFATFLVADATFAVAMAGVSLSSGGWLTVRYEAAYHTAEPVVLALLVLAAIEAIGRVPWAVAASLAVGVIVTMSVSPVRTDARVAVLGSVAVALTVSLVDRRALHAGLLLWFVLADLVAVLAVRLGEPGIRPALFQCAAQLVPLVGWLLWVGVDGGSAPRALRRPLL